MPNQVGLLPPQTLSEALADLARHESVGGWKELAVHIAPQHAEDPEGAGKWLDRALDDKRREVFHERHMRRALQLGHLVGCHVLWDWYCKDIGYATSEPLDTKSRRLHLLEEDERLARRRRQIQEEVEQIEKAETVATLRRVAD